MNTLIARAVHTASTVIEMMAVLVIIYGALEAFVQLVRTIVSSVPLEERRTAWLRFLRFLVVALTFQLAADLLNITVARTWEAVGHVAAIAAIRTFLGYFLDRDMRAAEAEKVRSA